MLPEGSFTKMLVVEPSDEARRYSLGEDALRVALKFDVLSVHLLVETPGEGVEMYTYDYDALTDDLRDDGQSIHGVDLFDLVTKICEKVGDGPDDVAVRVTLEDLAEDTGEALEKLLYP